MQSKTRHETKGARQMKNKDFNHALNNLKGIVKHNRRRTGHKDPYQVLKEDIYEITKRRELKMDEFGLAVYLRGKAKRYGNPFKLKNNTITGELNQSEWIIRKIRARLQIKGLIKYNIGIGKAWTEYTMLDSLMLPTMAQVTGQNTPCLTPR